MSRPSTSNRLLSPRRRATSKRNPKTRSFPFASGNFKLLKRGTMYLPIPTFVDVRDVETFSTLGAASSSRKLLHHDPLGKRDVDHLVYFDPSLKQSPKKSSKNDRFCALPLTVRTRRGIASHWPAFQSRFQPSPREYKHGQLFPIYVTESFKSETSAHDLQVQSFHR